MKRINDIQAWMGAAALCLSSCPLSAQQVVPTGEPVLSWQDSTQLKVAFSVAAGDVEITSDDRLIVTPRLTTKAGDTLTLPPVELAGKRNRRFSTVARPCVAKSVPSWPLLPTPYIIIRW